MHFFGVWGVLFILIGGGTLFMLYLLKLLGMLGLTELMERYSGGLGNAVQRVGPLPPGKYEVRAFAEDGRSTKRSVSICGSGGLLIF